ncbi:glycosyltransferase family 2 protein [Flavivirga jejuensis]|uniref:Glycosyltransferase family A protein n=1 Tax=Flavivirga jejuensis TaxID=870487 RepID=A0ABT8WKC6_9FLAO|nr:glycosyltransferase family A protein [Flavivirga jejuensis]MDO5973568.1 glycosyltransferase family A protein [Flavivirga jejuensis]
MLSILIPTYNYDITQLVECLHKQALECHVEFEIIVYDDASKKEFNKNDKINELENCLFKKLPQNIGRSAIRNLLGTDAKYESLLFIDAGTLPKKNDFLKNYLAIENKKVITGGMTPLEKSPKKPYRLRWLYTKKREFKVMCSSNFLIKKEVFMANLFDESLTQYGLEDILFFDRLLEKKINVLFFDNPVIHAADDDANKFIKKTEYAIENLVYLIKTKRIKSERFGISKTYNMLLRLKLHIVTKYIFKLVTPLLLKNFNSNFPSIFLLDFYKLGYYCSLKNKD